MSKTKRELEKISYQLRFCGEINNKVMEEIKRRNEEKDKEREESLLERHLADI